MSSTLFATERRRSRAAGRGGAVRVRRAVQRPAVVPLPAAPRRTRRGRGRGGRRGAAGGAAGRGARSDGPGRLTARRLGAAPGRGDRRHLRWPSTRSGPRSRCCPRCWSVSRSCSRGASSPRSGPTFHALILIFLGALAGFALTGDLFNMFVFFELMSVSAYALTAYRIDRPASLQGALTFAMTNSVGAVMILFGIALLYGRTGALNLAQVGEVLATRPSDGLVVVSFALITGGFLVKAAIVPFHFWLADAYAVAPTPAAIVFTGVMSDLGIYAVARIYVTVFEAPLEPHEAGLRAVLVGFGVLTALVGGGDGDGAGPPQAPAGVRHDQPDRARADRHRPAHARRHRGRRAADPRRRPAARGPVRLLRRGAAPLRIGLPVPAARARQAAATSVRDLLRRSASSGWPRCRHSAPSRARPWSRRRPSRSPTAGSPSSSRSPRC